MCDLLDLGRGASGERAQPLEPLSAQHFSRRMREVLCSFGGRTPSDKSRSFASRPVRKRPATKDQVCGEDRRCAPASCAVSPGHVRIERANPLGEQPAWRENATLKALADW